MASDEAKDFVHFLNKSPSPFHGVEELTKKLRAAGFKEVKESQKWDINPLGRYFVTKNQSTIVAFVVGGKYVSGEGGFSIIGTHTDSPGLKLKPVSKILKHGYLQVGVQLYGGGLWHSWFDRDLKMAGRVVVKTNHGLELKLVDIDRPIMRIPNLAIHLWREQNEKFVFDKEKHLAPIIATAIKDKLENTKCSSPPADNASEDSSISNKHHCCLLKLLAAELNCNTTDIMDFELNLLDYAPATIGGIYDEFIFGGRLDNLHSTYTAATGFINSLKDKSKLEADPNIRIYGAFDNEEVGSNSAQGAGSSFMIQLLRRLSYNGDNPTAFEQNIGRSILVSADCAHAVHPNFPEKHEDKHKPIFHGGITLKFNANQRYATSDVSASIIRQLASIAQVPLQDFVIVNAVPCGSTIGPIMATNLGMMTVDLGCPQLSMHSIREMCCTSGISQASALFKTFYENFPSVFASMKV